MPDEITYPLTAYNYRVDIDGSTIGFSEVSGLNIEYETITYKESSITSGSAAPSVTHMRAQGTPANITLKRGVVKDINVEGFYKWINKPQDGGHVPKKDITISLCDEKGGIVITWKVIKAFPTKLDAPSFSSSSSEVAVESLELMGDDVEISY